MGASVLYFMSYQSDFLKQLISVYKIWRLNLSNWPSSLLHFDFSTLCMLVIGLTLTLSEIQSKLVIFTIEILMIEKQRSLSIFVVENTSLLKNGRLLTACSAAPPATPHHLQRCTAYNAALLAMQHHLQYPTACNAPPLTMPHRLQNQK